MIPLVVKLLIDVVKQTPPSVVVGVDGRKKQHEHRPAHLSMIQQRQQVPNKKKSFLALSGWLSGLSSGSQFLLLAIGATVGSMS